MNFCIVSSSLLWVSMRFLRDAANLLKDLLRCVQGRGLSPVWVSIRVLKFPAQLNEFLHIVQLHSGCAFAGSTIYTALCVFSFKCTLKLLAWEDASSHWLHLFDFSPPCVWIFSAVSFQIACLRGYIITLVALFTFSNVSSNCLHEGMQNHTGCIILLFLHCESSNGLPRRVHNHNGCICLTFFPIVCF